MLREQPYYMKNKDWYYTIEIEKFKYKDVLTDLGKSIPEVVESYNEYQDWWKNEWCPDPVGFHENLQEIIEDLRADYKAQGLPEDEIEKRINDWKARVK